MTGDVETPTRRVALPVWVIALTSGGFGLFYAYALWTAVAFLAQCAAQGVTGYGWFVLLLPVVFPVVVFAGAFAVGWRRRLGVLAVLLLVGLTIVAVFWLNVLGLVASAPGSIFIQS